MTQLTELFRAVCEAWPEMKQPVVARSPRPDFAGDVAMGMPTGWNRSPMGVIDESTARLICGAAWAEKVMRDDPHTMTFEFYRGEFWCFRRGMCDEDLNEVSSGPDLCEAAANALVALARTTSP